MKPMLRKLCSPILRHFESGQEAYAYRDSHRKILIAVGLLFLLLSFGSLYVSLSLSEPGGILPVIGFLVVGVVCETVGWLGSDQAVARIWKRK